jgi:beta-glucosidase
VVTPADGIRSALPDATVIEDDGSDLQGAATLAATAEVAIVVVGYTRLDEGEFIGEFATAHLSHLFPGDDDPALVEAFNARIADERKIEPPPHAAPGAAGGFAVGGDRSSLHLHDEDVALIRAVSAANPRTVVALVAGSAVVVSEWDTDVPAVVQSWYSGMEGGHGLADVLLGTVDATGRLPFSVPRSASDLPAFERDAEQFTYDAWHGYWHLERHGIAPAYPFGFGLSYTTIALEGADAALEDGVLHVRAALRNHGERSGSDVVQVYARRLGAGRPARLVGFARVEVDEGRSRSIDMALPTATLAERDLESHSMVVRPGTYRLRVARHAVDPGIELSVDVGR